jgi:predicted transcriptional regulator
MARNATLHVKIDPETARNLKYLASRRKQTMGELVRQAINSCYQVDFLELTVEQNRTLSAYRGGFISIGKLSESMGMNVLQMRSWLIEHAIEQNTDFSEQDSINA